MAAILPSQTRSDEPITKENKPKKTADKKESRSGGDSLKVWRKSWELFG